MGFNSKIAGILNRQDDLLVTIEDKIKQQASRQVGKLKSKIPTENEIKKKYSFNKANSNTCSLEGLRKSEKDYKKLKKRLQAAKKITAGAEKGLKSVEKMCNKVLSLVEKVLGVLTVIGALISILTGAVNGLKIALTVVGAIFVPPPTGGTLMGPGTATFIKDKLDAAKGKIKVIQQSLKVYEPAVKKYVTKTLKFLGYVALGLGAIIALKNLVNFIIGLIETLYLGQLQKCAAINSDDESTNPNNVGIASIGGNRYLINYYRAITNNNNQYPETNTDDWNLLNTVNSNEIPEDNTPEWEESIDYIIEDRIKVVIDLDENTQGSGTQETDNGGINNAGIDGFGMGSSGIGRPGVGGLSPEEFLTNIGYTQATVTEGADPFDFSDSLASYYNSVLTNLQLTGNKEIIERIFNANFTMIGYKRYKV